MENGGFSLDNFQMSHGSCNIDEVPCWHDIKKDYESMENFLGVLDEGCAFGEYAMQNDGREKCPEKRVRSFSAIAMQNTLVISFSRSEWDKVISKKLRDIMELKRQFLNTTEAFKEKPRSLHLKLAEHMVPREVIKGEIICREGAPFDYVYFITSGWFQSNKKVKMPGGVNDGGEKIDEIKSGLQSDKDT